MNNLPIDKPCLVLAPHLQYPLTNGADILIDRRWSSMSKYLPYVDIVGEKTVNRYQNNKQISSSVFENSIRPKYWAAVRTVFNRSNFLLEKFITPNYLDTAREYIKDSRYGIVVFSFLCTASMIDILNGEIVLQNRLNLVETLNDEIIWFDNLFKAYSDPISKLVALLSKKWSLDFLKRHEKDIIYIHLTADDLEGYRSYIPRHEYFIFPAGISKPRLNLNSYEYEKIRLLFVGALNVKMNYDALHFFSERFYRKIKEVFDEELEVIVVGSNASNKVIKLTKDMGWILYKDVTDDELADMYQHCTCSILPFPYTTGAKIKLLNSLAHGVPFLATFNMSRQVSQYLPKCVFSDDPKEWIIQIKNIQKYGISEEDRRLFISYADNYSWDNLSNQIIERLRKNFT